MFRKGDVVQFTYSLPNGELVAGRGKIQKVFKDIEMVLLPIWNGLLFQESSYDLTEIPFEKCFLVESKKGNNVAKKRLGKPKKRR